MARYAEFSAGRWLRCANNLGQLWPQPINVMATIHDKIDNWLAADLHGELADNERNALHTHLVDCAACRKAHQETKTMNKILEDTLAHQKTDPAFEQRMLAGFRSRIPQRSRLVEFVSDLLRLRAAQITAVAAVLLGLVQLGRLITGESAILPRGRDLHANAQLPEPPSQVAASSEPGRAGTLDKSDELAAGKSKDMAFAAPQSSSENTSRLEREFKAVPATVAPAKAAQAEAAPQESGGEAKVMSYAQESSAAETPAPQLADRKLLRNATVELEIVSFGDAVQKITTVANEEHGYVATTNSEKQ